jgi:tetratricopeptide (TPR) repeat protein
LLLEKLPLLVLVLFSCVMTLLAQQRGGAVNSLKLTPWSERLANSSLAYVQYLGQTLMPLNLAAFYPFPHGRVSVPLAMAAGLLLACLTWLAWRERGSRPYLLVGWLWYLGTMVPVIGVVQVGGQAHADRYTYFPLIGIFLLVVWGLTDLSRRLHKERLGAWLAGAGMALLMLLSWHQASLWSDSVALWTHAVEVTENNWMAYKLLDDAYAKQGRRDRAERFFREKVRSNPGDAGAQNALGQVLSDRGNIEEAHRHFQEALRLDPDNSLVHYNLGQILLREKQSAEAVKHLRAYLKEDPNSGQGHNLLGLALMDMGQPEEAANHFEQALQLAPEFAGLTGQAPDSAPVLYNLGGALQAQGKWLEAADCFERTVALRSQSSKYHRALAFALDHLGRTQESQKEYRESLRLDANWPLAAARTAWVLATHPDVRQRNGGQALDYALQAYQAVGAGDPRILDALAAAYAETGRFEEAARTAKHAAEQADKIGQRELSQDIRNRFKLYTDKKSYHASP